MTISQITFTAPSNATLMDALVCDIHFYSSKAVNGRQAIVTWISESGNAMDCVNVEGLEQKGIDFTIPE